MLAAVAVLAKISHDHLTSQIQMEKTVHELGREKTAAIANLDFESAYDINQRILTQHEIDTDVKRRKYIDNIFGENGSFAKDRLMMERQSIDMDEQREIRAVKQDYVSKARSLAAKHRREAEELELKWREIYERTYKEAETRLESSLISARLLAKCDNYQSAINVRDATKEIDRTQVIECCDGFKRQFAMMMKRHETEFEHLHLLFKSYIQLLKNESEQLTLEATSRCIADESVCQVTAIDNAIRNVSDEKLKKSVIEHFSPRKATRK